MYSPVWLDRFLMWPVFVTGMLGGFATFGAFLVTLIGSFRRGVSGKSKVVLWGIVAVSVLACAYIALVPGSLITYIH